MLSKAGELARRCVAVAFEYVSLFRWMHVNVIANYYYELFFLGAFCYLFFHKSMVSSVGLSLLAFLIAFLLYLTHTLVVVVWAVMLLVAVYSLYNIAGLVQTKVSSREPRGRSRVTRRPMNPNSPFPPAFHRYSPSSLSPSSCG